VRNSREMNPNNPEDIKNLLLLSTVMFSESKHNAQLAGFRPNSEIIGKFGKMGKFYDHFL